MCRFCKKVLTQLRGLPYRYGHFPDGFYVTGSMKGGRLRTGFLYNSCLMVDRETCTAGAMTEGGAIIFMFIAVGTF